MPTDMRALQDFEDEGKLQIQMNDVITIIEGRSVSHAGSLWSLTAGFFYRKQHQLNICVYKSE